MSGSLADLRAQREATPPDQPRPSWADLAFAAVAEQGPTTTHLVSKALGLNRGQVMARLRQLERTGRICRIEYDDGGNGGMWVLPGQKVGPIARRGPRSPYVQPIAKPGSVSARCLEVLVAGPSSQYRLARSVGCNDGDMSRSLRRLQARGMVESVRGPRGRLWALPALKSDQS